MPLGKQNIPIVFGKGLETKYDEKVVAADKMLELENAVFTKRNRFSTRPGSDLLSSQILGSSDIITDAKKLLTFQDELLLATHDNLYSYIPSSDKWSDRGSISAVAIDSKSIVRNTFSQSVPDSFTFKGITVYAWEENSGVKACVIDESSGLPILSDVIISATGVKPKVMANKSYLFVYYIEGSNWKVRKLNLFDPSAFEAASTVASDIENNFDLYPHGDNLVYVYNTTGGDCNLGYIQLNGTIGVPLAGFPTDVDTIKPGDSSVAIVSKFDGTATDAIYVLYANSTDGLYCSVYNLNLVEIAATQIDPTTTVIRNITGILTDSTTLRVYYELYNAVTYNVLIYSADITNAGIASSPSVAIRSLGLASKAFKGKDNNIYVIGAYESTLQSSYFILKDTFTAEKLQVASVVAKWEGAGLTDKQSSLCNVTDYKFPNLIKTTLQSIDGDVFSLIGVQATTMNFNDEHLFNFKELGKNVHIAGGLLYIYDGISAVEQNFHFFPEAPSNTPSTTGGSIENGTRQYVFVYEWTDNQGQIHRSAPSIPLSVTNTGSGASKNTFTVPTLRLTKKCAACGRSEIRIVGYRTQNNLTTFYRFTSQTGSNLNDITANSITIVDTAADTSIDGNDILYTTGGVLENYSIGSAKTLDVYRNRLVVAGLEDGDMIRYSKERTVNEAINMAEELYFRADVGTGSVQGVARLDEKLLVFKPTEIYYQIGQGPTSTGVQDDYQQPVFITTDVGTTEPQSIVVMPLGIMFKSNKGYYLLSRALEPIYIGQSVERYNGLLVTSAILCDQFNEVRFTHSDGVCLSYNYNEQQWSVFKNKEAIAGVLWKNKWTIMRPSGAVYVENEQTFFDGQTPVTKKITTAWIQAATLQGAQRIYRVMFIGKLQSQHRLKIEISYDFDPSIKETFYFDTETILGSNYYGEGYYGQDSFYGGADPVYQIELRPSIQKCQAIRFTLQDLNDNDVDGAGFELTGMTIQVGIKQGMFRPAMSKRVGPS